MPPKLTPKLKKSVPVVESDDDNIQSKSPTPKKLKKSAFIVESDEEIPALTTEDAEESAHETPPRARKSKIEKHLYLQSPSSILDVTSDNENPFVDNEAEEIKGDDAEYSNNSLGDFIVDDEEVEEVLQMPKKQKKISSSKPKSDAVDTEEDIEETVSISLPKSKGSAIKSKKAQNIDSDHDVEIINTSVTKSPSKSLNKVPANNTKKSTPIKTDKALSKRSTRSHTKGKKPISPEFIDESEQEPLEDLPLQKDDTMYKGPPSSQRIISKKRPIPTTPPLQTRSTAVEDNIIIESPLESPTKKQKIKAEKLDKLSDPKSTALTKSGPFKGRIHSVTNTDDSDYDETMADTLKNDDQKADKVVFLADLTTLVIKSLPKKCEVDDPNLRDEYLTEHNGYNDLPPLRACEIRTANGKAFTGTPNGRFLFSAWQKVAPKLKLVPATGIITFVQDEHIINLSRISPLLLAGRLLNNNRYEVVVDNRTALCITPVITTDSYLGSDAPYLSSPFHFMKGIFHSFEWERFCGALGMLCNQKVLGGQVWNDHVTFQSKTKPTGQSSGSGTASSFLPSSYFNTFESPTKTSKSLKPVNGKSIAPLEYHDTIPIYDGRKVSRKIQWSAEILSNLEESFPRWNEQEIPKASCVVVGYIVHIISGSGNQEWKVYNYIQWALVLSSGSDK